MSTAIAIFNDASKLQRALDDLHSSGIDSDRIRVIEGTAQGGEGGDSPGESRASASSMVQVGLAGRAAYPGDTRVATTAGIGAVGAGAPVAAAAAGGLYDSLRGFGVSEEEAQFFGDSLDEDTHLLAVQAGDEAERVYTIFRSAGASRTNEPGS